MGNIKYVQYWGCGEEYFLRNCPHRKDNTRNTHNIKEAILVEDIERIVPMTYVALEDHQVDRLSDLVKIKGKIANQSLLVPIDIVCSHIYVNPRVA